MISAHAKHLPFLENAVEAWHALVIPYAHRGSVKWRKSVQTDSAIKPAAADPKGPLMIITTTSYDSQVDGREGCTVSLWRDDKAMMAAAHKGGEHKGQLDYHKVTPHFDRSSFTRGRIVASAGTWDGTDPVKDMALA